MPSTFDPTAGHLTALVPLLPGNLPFTRKEAWQIPWDTHENLDLFRSVRHYTLFIFVRTYFFKNIETEISEILRIYRECARS